MNDKPDLRPENHVTEARIEAVRRVRERLTGADLDVAVSHGGLAAGGDGAVEVVLLGRPFRVELGTLDVMPQDQARVSPVDELLILRYLEVERAVEPLGEDITFRDLPGGSFYAAALAKRTTDLIAKAFGDDAKRLHHALGRYPHTPLDLGDASARINAIGRLDVTLVLHEADDEFPASAQILYDRIIASVYSSDEVAALTTQLCVGLIR
jgi:uncharacterized protein DUF3786